MNIGFKNIVFIGLWCACLMIGLSFLWTQESETGRQGNFPEVWPKKSHLSRIDGLPTLVMFAHPKCPCSEKSISQLSQLLKDIEKKAAVHVVFYKPEEKKDYWAKDRLWSKVVRFKNTGVLIDSKKHETTLFDPKTSGQVYLYSPEGRLVFSGGITADSDNDLSMKGIKEYILEKKMVDKKFSVFGCSLFHNGGEISQVDWGR